METKFKEVSQNMEIENEISCPYCGSLARKTPFHGLAVCESEACGKTSINE